MDTTLTIPRAPAPAADECGELPVSPMAQLARLLGDASLPARRFGELGEEYAAAWLEHRGHRILSRNWRTRFGELDVVSMSPDGMVVFAEVKTRHGTAQGTPQEAVTKGKQRRLRHAGVEWLLDPSNRMPHRGVRFDVIAILVRGGKPAVRHIAGAF
ncbi:YraN family protein [Bifidobacterium pullorum subsp. saeculare]|uniref:UPF0102 protein H7U32_06040 n=1 Tax=Bifidobacterium pullorum subsp. saeculare TaxID=78257 RepID=A0A939B8H0_9BIFI|nr:YraN family protein [Bifidobacterium pullorum subsp. saeculare]